MACGLFYPDMHNVKRNTDNKGQGRRGGGLQMRYGWISVTDSYPFYFKALLFLQIGVRKMNP